MGDRLTPYHPSDIEAAQHLIERAMYIDSPEEVIVSNHVLEPARLAQIVAEFGIPYRFTASGLQVEARYAPLLRNQGIRLVFLPPPLDPVVARRLREQGVGTEDRRQLLRLAAQAEGFRLQQRQSDPEINITIDFPLKVIQEAKTVVYNAGPFDLCGATSYRVPQQTQRALQDLSILHLYRLERGGGGRLSNEM